jgi:hypothetical protein
MKNWIKKKLVGKGLGFHKVKFGIAKGLKYFLDTKDKTQLFLGLYEIEIHKYFKKYAQKADIMFDIGAAYGYYSLIYRKFNKNGQIYSFDPGVGKFDEIYRKNFNENFGTFENVNLSGKLVGNNPTDEFIKIDDVLKNKTGKTVLFKIDVDGGELDVLKSGLESFKNNKCYFVVETHSFKLEEDCVALLRHEGFTVKIIKNGWYRIFIKDLRPLELNRWFIAYKE